MALALHGGTPEVRTPLKPFNTIGREEIAAATRVLEGGVLSGFLGGELRGGHHVRALEDAWCETFGVKHAVACNSATSGLLAACAAVGMKHGKKFMVSPFTMSATAAAPTVLGAESFFGDIESRTFGLDTFPAQFGTNFIVITNLFGHPANLREFRRGCDMNRGLFLIEDNAQSPFAMEYGRYAGTIGHLGVFSLNVHKHFQCGEGGIVVTNDDNLAAATRHAINHGEMAGMGVGLNLRMTEITAAIALVQLRKAPQIIADRVGLAESLTRAVKGISGLTPPVVRDGCTHVYYLWALKITDRRDEFVHAMQAEGVPLRAGYVDPLYRLPAFSQFARSCPVAERMHDKELALFEICAFDPTPEQIAQIGNAFHKVAEGLCVAA